MKFVELWKNKSRCLEQTLRKKFKPRRKVVTTYQKNRVFLNIFPSADVVMTVKLRKMRWEMVSAYKILVVKLGETFTTSETKVKLEG
jgi:hypothetical protein